MPIVLTETRRALRIGGDSLAIGCGGSAASSVMAIGWSLASASYPALPLAWSPWLFKAIDEGLQGALGVHLLLHLLRQDHLLAPLALEPVVAAAMSDELAVSRWTICRRQR